jgi:hypothetical protein
VDAIWAIEEEGNRRGRLLKREATERSTIVEASYRRGRLEKRKAMT